MATPMGSIVAELLGKRGGAGGENRLGAKALEFAAAGGEAFGLFGVLVVALDFFGD